jgi:predicted metal-dependent enzyme (double-stranded beta helix superfamily)
MQSVPLSPRAQAMITRLDAAVEQCANNDAYCQAVKKILEAWIHPRADFLGPEFLAPKPDCYARRLLYRHPEGAYSVAIMVWGVGQGTPIHDHAGLWCVECVYRGCIRVDSYDLQGTPEDEEVGFKAAGSVTAGCGSAGALIPPFDYHVIENAGDEPAITVHVYGGDMEWCHAYVPVEGGLYRRDRKALSFTA